MVHSEQEDLTISDHDFATIRTHLNTNNNDAQIIIWGPEEDMETAIETVVERCEMIFDGVPNETRKSFPDGTTIFERVLPGADRMYPYTDSCPIPLSNEYIEKLGKDLPQDISERIELLSKWAVPADAFHFILSKNIFPIIEEICERFKFDPKRVAIFFGHTYKNIVGKQKAHNDFNYRKLIGLFKFIREKGLHINIAKYLLPILFQHPSMEFNSMLTALKFKKRSLDELAAPIDFLAEKYRDIRKTDDKEEAANWIMGQLHKQAIGNIELRDLREIIDKRLQ